ncbi:TPA: restriction endonuclease subunit S [Vibrio cholerae]
MSHLSYIEKLLDGVEVEWRPLEKVIHSLKTGLNPRKNFQLNTSDAQGYYVTVREIQDGKIVFLEKTDRVNDRALELINGRSNLEVGDILFSGTGTVGRTAVIEAKPANWNIKEGVYTIKPIQEKILPRFLSHLLNSSEIVKDYGKKIVGNPVVSLPMGELKKLLVPIPCPDNPEKSLAIQAEIVRILDAFTAMTAELTAELNMRKKQYNYYREKLLASELPSSKTATLGEILDMRAGKHIKAKDISAIKNAEHKYICFGGNGSRGFVQEYSHEGDYALIGRQGALCGNVKRAKGKFYATEHAVVCTPKEEIDIDWAFHMLTFMNLNQYKSQSAQPGLAVGNLANLTINVPTISEQRKIAKILNKFDTLTTSLQEGLPREIELRQKQYEYYRDLLLSFPASPAGGPKSHSDEEA